MPRTPLSAYRRKRNFAQTPEPSGEASVAPARALRFVVQKHAARQLHYDLRLELDGTFKSWAVTRGPSLDPHDKRLAVEVEDHPLDYGDFEGTIPKGHYGGGTVMIWDRGTWTPDQSSPREALAEGDLKFTLKGRKLHGSWVLVRMKRDWAGGKRSNWLLIKHADDAARESDGGAILDDDRSVASGRSMDDIAAGTGRRPRPFMTRAKMSAGSAREPNKIPTGVQPKQRARTAAARQSTTGERMASPAAARKISARSAAGRVTVMGVALSHPDKELWPAADRKAAVTKLDLARYFEAVGPAMLPHVAHRPCSIVRAPDGIDGEHFFQRHTGPGTSHLPTIAVAGDPKAYLAIARVEDLIVLAQVGAMELHPSNCLPNEPETPGRLIFDLDPAPDVDFARVIEAAREIRDRLERLGLIAFAKTTGGKGMHVVTPLLRDTAVRWPQAKAFAQQICAEMAAESPDRYLIAMSKAARVGHIFLDYLRNDHLSTAVAPFSPRARPGATVSMPLTWPQVRAGLDPKRYTIGTVPGLLKRSRAWDGYDEAARPLPALQKTRRALEGA